MGASRLRSVLGLLALSGTLTAGGVLLAFQVELTLLPRTPSSGQLVVVGLVEESLVRLVPLIATFYVWSYLRGQLLTKTQGFLATVVSGLVVAGLELVLKLQYLSELETVARFDSLLLPIVFVHLPFALIAGRFAYALGQRVHDTESISTPTLSRRTVAILVSGYLLLALAHVLYNSAVVA